MLISRNCSRQGAPSESDEAVVTCGESLESRSNAVLRDLHNLQSVTTRKSPLTARMLVGGNFARQGAPSESDEAVVTYGESLESRPASHLWGWTGILFRPSGRRRPGGRSGYVGASLCRQGDSFAVCHRVNGRYCMAHRSLR